LIFFSFGELVGRGRLAAVGSVRGVFGGLGGGGVGGRVGLGVFLEGGVGCVGGGFGSGVGAGGGRGVVWVGGGGGWGCASLKSHKGGLGLAVFFFPAWPFGTWPFFFGVVGFVFVVHAGHGWLRLFSPPPFFFFRRGFFPTYDVSFEFSPP